MIYKWITNSRNRRLFESITVLITCAFIMTLNGCVSTNTIDIKPAKVPAQTEYQFVKVLMKNGLVINLKDKNALYFKEYEGHKNVIVYPKDNIIELKEALQVTVEKEETDVALTILSTLGVIATVVGIIIVVIALTKESCPFVYSYDGAQYMFDAEPYGGAITEGLTKTDFSRLEYLKPVNGEYRLFMRNEADETQHTDEMKMLVIDHDPDLEIVPDVSGNMKAYKKIISPVSATDENGFDITSMVKEKDNIKWQTSFPSDTSIAGKNFRHELIFKFPKPKDARNVKLIINAGTALWGGFMIKKLLKLRGNKVDDWYDNINNKGPELKKLYEFIDREELYSLKINVLEDANWVQKGIIPAGGPFIFEDRVIEINTENIAEDTLTVKLEPPYGFWEIDKIGVTYDDFQMPGVREVPVRLAADENGTDITKLLESKDGKYYDMPDTTSKANIYFMAPPQSEGTKRTIYLKTTGYYDIHLKKDEPEQTELIEKIWNNYGYVLQYSMRLYFDYARSLGFMEK